MIAELKYGVRMSLLVLDSDYERTALFRHPTENCDGCDRLVIGSKATGPIVCEDCLELILKRGHCAA